MAVGDGTAAGSVRARFEGRFDMAEDDRRTKVLDRDVGGARKPNLRGGCRKRGRSGGRNALALLRVIRTRLVGGGFSWGRFLN